MVFAAGVVFGGFFVCVVWKLTERECRQGGMLDFTGAHTPKGGTASADSHLDSKLSGGRTSPAPVHLRLIRDNGSTEVLIPLDEGRD